MHKVFMYQMTTLKIKPNHVYYDETNSHPLDADIFFADILFSTQSMELDGEEVIFYFILFLFF